ncbi:MAG: hypothetical protein GYB35_16130 [Algicola sp.]|nr:hypothetical protein [Algicola sp.]
MKTILKLGLCFVFVTLNSCTSENTLTNETVLEQLQQLETENPIVFKSTISKVFVESNHDLSTGNNNYYKKLFNEGYIETVIRTDIPNAQASARPYQVVLTTNAEPYILEENNKTAQVITLEFNAVSVKAIRIINDFKAEVDVEYVKTKSPFYNPDSKDISQSGKEYPNETYVKTLEFRKDIDNHTWHYPIQKIVF